MKFIADLHIHSHYSIATSNNLCPEWLEYWANIKGITVIGTGDFTHPGWLNELKEKLQPAEQGLFKLKQEYKFDTSLSAKKKTRFLLTGEISCIYKKYNKVRKVHSIIFAPDFETVENIQKELSIIGNITSDGRPILGLDSKDLLEIALTCSEDIFFVPAHIWTPWFSILGSKSGFDSIKECFGDLTSHIHAVETGLSSDPPMNWKCSFLDNYTLVSNSDAHSPQKLGREANLFNTELNYNAIINALKTGNNHNFLGTVEFFPQEGKYFFDGHRKCGIRQDPFETINFDGICSKCGKKVTEGVLNRVTQLSDRKDISQRKNKNLFYSVIPLKEILSEILKAGVNTKRVNETYNSIIKKVGSELDILLNVNLEVLESKTNDILSEAIRRMRDGKVHIREGYDGEFGKIMLFNETELLSINNPKSIKF